MASFPPFSLASIDNMDLFHPSQIRWSSFANRDPTRVADLWPPVGFEDVNTTNPTALVSSSFVHTKISDVQSKTTEPHHTDDDEEDALNGNEVVDSDAVVVYAIVPRRNIKRRVSSQLRRLFHRISFEQYREEKVEIRRRAKHVVHVVGSVTNHLRHRS